jgi:hypothetical protein
MFSTYTRYYTVIYSLKIFCIRRQNTCPLRFDLYNRTRTAAFQLVPLCLNKIFHNTCLQRDMVPSLSYVVRANLFIFSPNDVNDLLHARRFQDIIYACFFLVGCSIRPCRTALMLLNLRGRAFSLL